MLGSEHSLTCDSLPFDLSYLYINKQTNKQKRCIECPEVYFIIPSLIWNAGLIKMLMAESLRKKLKRYGIINSPLPAAPQNVAFFNFIHQPTKLIK